jgi:hypothetical protein
VIIRHPCELQPFEVLNGGLGNDTLITPISVAKLFLAGVYVSHFETIIVDDQGQHLSECF